MTEFVISSETKSDIARVIDFSSKPENHYKLSGTVVPGDNPAHVVQFKDYRCVFSITEVEGSNLKIFLYRHLSISKENLDLPSQYESEEIARLFGFTGGISDWKIAVHSFPHNHDSIIIIAQVL